MTDNLNITRFNQLLTVSNPDKVKRNLKKYLPTDTPEISSLIKKIKNIKF